jgi:hypothetical protein
MNGRHADAMSWRYCVSRLRMASYTDNLPHVVDLQTLAELARRMLAGRDADGAR